MSRGCCEENWSRGIPASLLVYAEDRTGALALKMREWKMKEEIAWVENAGTEKKTGAITYGKPSKQKTLY